MIVRWPRRRLRGAAAVAFTGCLLLSACGVPAGGETRILETQSVPFGLLQDRRHSTDGQSDGSREPGEARRQIALIDGDARVRLVQRDVALGSATTMAGLLLQQLQNGPSDLERQQGLESAIPAGMELQVVGWRRGVLSVGVSGEPSPAADRLPLAVAQIVLTVSSVTEVRAVLFESGDALLQVPLLDGSLTSAPLSRRHYQSLLAPSPVASSAGSRP